MSEDYEKQTEIKLPSRFQIGDHVLCGTISPESAEEGVVTSVEFEKSKVYYWIKVSSDGASALPYESDLVHPL